MLTVNVGNTVKWTQTLDDRVKADSNYMRAMEQRAAHDLGWVLFTGGYVNKTMRPMPEGSLGITNMELSVEVYRPGTEPALDRIAEWLSIQFEKKCLLSGALRRRDFIDIMRRLRDGGPFIPG